MAGGSPVMAVVIDYAMVTARLPFGTAVQKTGQVQQILVKSGPANYT